MAMRKPGPYAPLSAHYADDEAIMAAGEDAELLYVRMLAYAARTPTTEGWISDAVLQSRLGILERPGVAGTDAGSRAGRLMDVGLISRDGTGYRIRSWLRWNRSAEEMGREAARDRNRKTSHNDGQRAGNGAGNGAGIPAATPPAETDTETEARRTSGDADASPRPDVEALCDHLAGHIERNGSKRPTIGKTWRDAARRLIDTDGRDPQQAARLIDWCQRDEFWAANILSMPKFRAKYDQLRLQANRDWQRNGGGAVSVNGDIDVDRVLGHDVWSLPAPPDGIEPGTQAYAEWARLSRREHHAERVAEARAALEFRRTSA